jgi:hypothetical protein
MMNPAGSRARTGLVATAHRHVVWVIGVLAVCAYVAIYAIPLADNPVRSDGQNYFVYLPSWVIYGDTTLEEAANHRFGGTFPAGSAVTRWPVTGRWVNPHQMGVAVLLLPLYLAGHVLTVLTGFPREGWSFFYRHAAGLGGPLYLMLGLFVLKRLLDRLVSPAVALATILTLTFGTNLFHYATFDSLWSHVYSFSLIACFLYLVEDWERRPTSGRAAVLGAVLGLIVLVRHANASMLLFLPLFGLVDVASVRARPRELLARAPQVAVLALTMGVVVSPQLALYKASTGAFFVDPYLNLIPKSGVPEFDFLHPHLAGVLVGVRKGLFFWSPALLLGVAGFFTMRGRLRDFRLPSIAVIALSTLLIASWWDWQFGGSYGHRGFTDLLAMFALPLAALYDRAAGRPAIRTAVTVFAGLAVTLSIIQMLQYWAGIIPFSDVTWDQYRAFFLRFSR